MLLPTSHFPPLSLAVLILISTSCWSSSSGQKHLPPSSSSSSSKSAVVGIRSHGIATINAEQKSNLERGINHQSREESLAKALRHIEEADPNANNVVVDNSLLPRTRSRLRARMSKSDPPQVQTDALRSDDDPENFADLAAEESINDPLYYKDLPLPRRPEYSTLFIPATTTVATSGATSFVNSTQHKLEEISILVNDLDNLKHREPRSAEASPQNLPFDPLRAKRHRQQQQQPQQQQPSSPSTNRAPAPNPLPESGPRVQAQADRRFFHPENAVVGNAPEEFYSASSPAPPPIYYDFQPASSSISPSKQVDSNVYHDSLALPDSFDPTYALPPVLPASNPSTSLPTSQRYQSYQTPSSFINGSPTPPVATTSRSGYQGQIESFHPGQVLTEKQSTSFGVPPVVVDPNHSLPATSKKNKGPTSGYYPPIPRVMPRVDHMEAECSDDVMKLRVKFNATFSGLIYSAGYSYDSDCIYINGTGVDEYEFFIQLNRCGTLGGSDHNKKRDANIKNTDPTKNYMWNTVTIQYNPLIEEEWDEHFKVTCEYGYDFWKTVTFPFLDVEVNTADPVHFTLTPPECHMEIRNGYGTTGTKVAGPVHVGDPITLLILMRSQWDGFDIVVNDCFAHNGANKKIQLIDHHGCPVDDKLISKFQGTWGMANTMYETLIYAHMKTFRFTGTPALYIECDIRMCHGRCPTQSCNWRSSKAVPNPTRKRRNAVDGTTDVNDDIEEEGEISSDPQALAMSAFNESLSDSINLFQAIHVLQSKEDELALKKNETSSEPLTTGENTICVESMVLAAIIGSLSMVALLSSVIVTFLCLRLRKHKSSDNSDTLDASGTQHLRSTLGLSHKSSENSYVIGGSSDLLRSRMSLKSEYVHSAQARIP